MSAIAFLVNGALGVFLMRLFRLPRSVLVFGGFSSVAFGRARRRFYLRRFRFGSFGVSVSQRLALGPSFSGSVCRAAADAVAGGDRRYLKS